MKAVVCTRYGPPDELELRELPEPVPRADEVVIRVRATAVTSSDCYLRGLRLPPAYRLVARLVVGWNAPRRSVLGMVLSGEVHAVGEHVRSFAVGDRVFGFDRHRFGAYAQFACWPEDALLCARPADVSDEDAAAITYGGLLALHLLRKSGVRAGHRVLVYGASGAVGTALVQLARARGADVTAVCGPQNLDLVAGLGASRVVDYTTEDVTARDERYDVVLDAVGKAKSGAVLSRAGEVLAPGGVVVSIDDGTPKFDSGDLATLAAAATSGELIAVIDRTYPLEEVAEAHRYVDGGHKRGNVVVTVA